MFYIVLSHAICELYNPYALRMDAGMRQSISIRRGCSIIIQGHLLSICR
jgi:hypothetical protein